MSTLGSDPNIPNDRGNPGKEVDRREGNTAATAQIPQIVDLIGLEAPETKEVNMVDVKTRKLLEIPLGIHLVIPTDLNVLELEGGQTMVTDMIMRGSILEAPTMMIIEEVMTNLEALLQVENLLKRIIVRDMIIRGALPDDLAIIVQETVRESGAAGMYIFKNLTLPHLNQEGKNWEVLKKECI